MGQTKTGVNPLARIVRPPEPIDAAEPLRPIEIDADGGCDALLRGLTAGGKYEAGGLLGIDAPAGDIANAVREALQSIAPRPPKQYDEVKK